MNITYYAIALLFFTSLFAAVNTWHNASKADSDTRLASMNTVSFLVKVYTASAAQHAGAAAAFLDVAVVTQLLALAALCAQLAADFDPSGWWYWSVAIFFTVAAFRLNISADRYSRRLAEEVCGV